jgi:hypothetical protein
MIEELLFVSKAGDLRLLEYNAVWSAVTWR